MHFGFHDNKDLRQTNIFRRTCYTCNFNSFLHPLTAPKQHALYIKHGNMQCVLNNFFLCPCAFKAFILSTVTEMHCHRSVKQENICKWKTIGDSATIATNVSCTISELTKLHDHSLRNF